MRLHTDDDELATAMVDLIIADRHPFAADRYIQKIADDGGLDRWIDLAVQRRDEAAAAANRARRVQFNRDNADKPLCGCAGGGHPGGHLRDGDGWCACPHERARLAAEVPSWDF
jgi:hypothetical protein